MHWEDSDIVNSYSMESQIEENDILHFILQDNSEIGKHSSNSWSLYLDVISSNALTNNRHPN